ncbi:MAG: hypothetical protein BWY47_00091 [Bacteroidetes bacterium ADurb.Bin302]|nr:MAG: hypothetical protein BWY47_00091 [Bacteroidetes bacterium ADurb.Bin302]
MNILRLGNPKAKKEDKIKRFECEICGCIWQANKNEYKEDWSKHSIPVYCKCPCCKTEVYAIGTFQDDLPKHSHIKGD